MINIFLRRLLQPQPALSTIELLVASTILALLSTAGLKMFQSTQTSFVDGRTSLVKAKRNEAIAAFIYNDFVDKALPPTTSPRLYVNNQMPDDLQAAEKLAVATIFGTGSRFQFAAPKCRLSRDADPDLSNVNSPADCMRFGQTTFAQRVNQILALGAKIVFRSTAPALDAASAGRSKAPMLATWRLLMLMIVCVCAWRMIRKMCRKPAIILCCPGLLSITASTRPVFIHPSSKM